MKASTTTTRTNGGQERSPAGEGARQGNDEEEAHHHQQLRVHAHNLLTKKNARGQTALLAAIRPYSFASQANLAVVRRLIKLGAEVNERETGTGNTALHYAATTNSVALCECVRPAGVTCEELV
jgi:ankyrin repeat protein